MSNNNTNNVNTMINFNRGRFASSWLAATSLTQFNRSYKRSHIITINIVELCDGVTEMLNRLESNEKSNGKLLLRHFIQIVYGIVVIFQMQVKICYDQVQILRCTRIVVNIDQPIRSYVNKPKKKVKKAVGHPNTNQTTSVVDLEEVNFAGFELDRIQNEEIDLERFAAETLVREDEITLRETHEEHLEHQMSFEGFGDEDFHNGHPIINFNFININNNFCNNNIINQTVFQPNYDYDKAITSAQTANGNEHAIDLIRQQINTFGQELNNLATITGQQNATTTLTTSSTIASATTSTTNCLHVQQQVPLVMENDETTDQNLSVLPELQKIPVDKALFSMNQLILNENNGNIPNGGSPNKRKSIDTDVENQRPKNKRRQLIIDEYTKLIPGDVDYKSKNTNKNLIKVKQIATKRLMTTDSSNFATLKLLNNFKRFCQTRPSTNIDYNMLQTILFPNAQSNRLRTNQLELNVESNRTEMNCVLGEINEIQEHEAHRNQQQKQVPQHQEQLQEAPQQQEQPQQFSVNRKDKIEEILKNIERKFLTGKISAHNLRAENILNDSHLTDSEKLSLTNEIILRERWTKFGILDRLFKLWDKNEYPINMNRLCESIKLRKYAAIAFASIVELSTQRYGLIKIEREENSTEIYHIGKSDKLINLLQME